jgi:hypothetical protein
MPQSSCGLEFAVGRLLVEGRVRWASSCEHGGASALASWDRCVEEEAWSAAAGPGHEEYSPSCHCD